MILHLHQELKATDYLLLLTKGKMGENLKLKFFQMGRAKLYYLLQLNSFLLLIYYFTYLYIYIMIC